MEYETTILEDRMIRSMHKSTTNQCTVICSSMEREESCWVPALVYQLISSVLPNSKIAETINIPVTTTTFASGFRFSSLIVYLFVDIFKPTEII